MPVYNAENYISDTISSILNQTFIDFEFLICDDGSNDNSVQIINKFSDPRIKLYINNNNQGYIKTLNFLIKESSGKYIARQDNDDISLNSRLELQYDLMEKNPSVGICGSNAKSFGKKNITSMLPITDKEIKVYFIFQNPFYHPSVFLRRSILKKSTLIYDSNFFPAEDYELWFRVSKKYKTKNISKVLLHYRVHDNNTSSKSAEIQKKNMNVIRENIFRYYFDCGILDYENKILNNLELNSFDLDFISKYVNFVNKLIKLNKQKKAVNQTSMNTIIIFFWVKLCVYLNADLINKIKTFLKPEFINVKNLFGFLASKMIYKQLFNRI